MSAQHIGQIITGSRCIRPAGFESHDEFVRRSPDGTIYHTAAWSDVVTRCYGFRSRSLVAADSDGSVRGFLPLMLVASPFTGKRLVSLPYTNLAGPLGDAAAAADLLDAAIDLARRTRCKYLELRGTAGQAQHPALARLDYYGTFVLDLAAGTAPPRARYDKRARRGIAKAEKAGVEVVFGDGPSAARDFHCLNLLTRRKHGVPPQPRAFFERLWQALRPIKGIEILLARHEGEVVAGIVLLAYKDTVTYAYGASDQRYLRYAPNHALFDRAILWAAEQGYRHLDFGRTAPDNEGLMEFKRQWGASFQPMPYHYWPNRAGFVAEPEAGWKHRLFTRLWRRLPVPVTAVLGPALYRHMA